MFVKLIFEHCIARLQFRRVPFAEYVTFTLRFLSLSTRSGSRSNRPLMT